MCLQDRDQKAKARLEAQIKGFQDFKTKSGVETDLKYEY